MPITSQEWLKQSEYDFDTARYMHDGKRFYYAVFMCHQSVEKALKGLFQNKTGKIPEKTHSLVYLLNQMQLKPEEKIAKLIIKLNAANVMVRYPEDIEKLSKEYDAEKVGKILERCEEVLKWIKTQY